jgi:hypothetical protein
MAAGVPRRPSIFINCPFDPDFQPLLRAILFTVCAMGCKPRSALEESDSSTLRLEKIYWLIQKCRLSIHDLSRTELSARTGFPRFNMPLELGIFLGIKCSSSSASRKKTCLAIIKEIGYEPDEPQYGDILKITAKWLEANPAQISVSASGEIATTTAGDVAKANRPMPRLRPE